MKMKLYFAECCEISDPGGDEVQGETHGPSNQPRQQRQEQGLTYEGQHDVEARKAKRF